MMRLRFAAAALFIVAMQLAWSQGNGPGPNEIPPESLVQDARAAAAVKKGRELLQLRKLDLAISSFKEAVDIVSKLPGRDSVCSYELAKALTLAGKTEAALAAYKRAVHWNAETKDLEVNYPFPVKLAMDYAVLLADCGKANEAKALYYFGLRRFNPEGTAYYEPFPLLVVFAPDPGMTVWGYTPAHLKVAAMMAKARCMFSEEKSTVEAAQNIEPTWIVPVVYLATVWNFEPSRSKALQEAARLARTDEERNWIRLYLEAEAIDDRPAMWQRRTESGFQLAQIGRTRRLASKVLERARQDLEQTYPNIAS